MFSDIVHSAGYNSLHYQICPSVGEAEDLRQKMAPYAIDNSRLTLGSVLMEGEWLSMLCLIHC